MARRLVIGAAAAGLLALVAPEPAQAQAVLPSVSVDFGAAEGVEAWTSGLQILLLLTVLSLAPSILVMMTAFTRIVVVLAFVRYAMSTQQLPPTQVLIALALFLTFFVMAPVWQQAYDQAWVPFRDGEIDQATALERAMEPAREFMFRHTRERDLALFIDYAGLDQPEGPDDVPSYLLIPAFAISELKTAFQIGFIIFVPFVVIDMIVASTLMSMGMLMVPPMMVSLPFKVLLFVLVDGWHLVVESLLMGFGG